MSIEIVKSVYMRKLHGRGGGGHISQYPIAADANVYTKKRPVTDALTEQAPALYRFCYASAAVVRAGRTLLVVPLPYHDTVTASQPSTEHNITSRCWFKY